jgi:hypothetical protein
LQLGIVPEAVLLRGTEVTRRFAGTASAGQHVVDGFCGKCRAKQRGLALTSALSGIEMALQPVAFRRFRRGG